MVEYELHSITYEATTTTDWEAPQKSDFDTDDLAAIDDHYLVSSSGFPPDSFEDLALPVVDTDDRLNRDALSTAYAGAHSVEAIDDIDDQTVGQVKGVIQSLAHDAFDHDID